MKMLFVLAAVLLSSSASAKTINDSWYTMQAGSAPWGYYHEKIEQLPDGRYSYRYQMKKIELSKVIDENIGAYAQADLTPITFNLIKAGQGVTETIDGTYLTEEGKSFMQVKASGAKATLEKRILSPGTILDVFFPVWLTQKAERLKVGAKGSLKSFTEDPGQRGFFPKEVRYSVLGNNPHLKCLDIDVVQDSQTSHWCLSADGVLQTLKVGAASVRRVSSEKEAIDFLKPLLAKPQQKGK